MVELILEFYSWCNMRRRCYEITNDRYHRYGGRGIIVCDRWLNSFENFFADMGEKPSQKHSIEREDNDGNYEPSNCYWGTKKEQANNRSSNVFIEHNGIVKTITDWELFLLNRSKGEVTRRLNKGQTFEHIYNYYANKHGLV